MEQSLLNFDSNIYQFIFFVYFIVHMYRIVEVRFNGMCIS